jgi:hypothetical protein
MSLVTGGDMWPPPPQPVRMNVWPAVVAPMFPDSTWPPPPEPVGMGILIHLLDKGMTPAQVKKRLGLGEEACGYVAGTTMTCILGYRIGGTHDLTLFFRRGAEDWEFYHADLQPIEAERPHPVGPQGYHQIESPPVPWLKTAKP